MFCSSEKNRSNTLEQRGTAVLSIVRFVKEIKVYIMMILLLRGHLYHVQLSSDFVSCACYRGFERQHHEKKLNPFFFVYSTIDFC